MNSKFLIHRFYFSLRGSLNNYFVKFFKHYLIHSNLHFVKLAKFFLLLDSHELFPCKNRKLKIYEEQELTMKIFAEPSEFQLPINENSSSGRQKQPHHQHQPRGNPLTQNLLGMETPPTPLLDTYNGSETEGDLETNYATILNYTINNNSNSNNTNNNDNIRSSSTLVNNSRGTNNIINLIDADYQTVRNTVSPRIPVSTFIFNYSLCID